MRILPLTLACCFVLVLGACSGQQPKTTMSSCFARELDNGVVKIARKFTIGEAVYYDFCPAVESREVMTKYIGNHPELDVEVLAPNRFDSFTDLQTKPRTKTPANQ